MQRQYPLDPTQSFVQNPALAWVNGNPSSGQEGSFPPCTLMTNPQDEILNVIVAANIVPSQSDLSQLLEAIQHLIAVAIATVVYGATNLGGLAIDGNRDFLLNFTNLVENDTPQPGDLFAFEQIASSTPAKITFAALLAQILARVPQQTQSSSGTSVVSNAPPKMTIYTASGTHTPAANSTGALVICTGGGGGGGATSNQGSTAGGSAGGTAIAMVALGTTPVAVTVGGGGGAGLTSALAGNGVALGGSGGTTSFGLLCQASGGAGQRTGGGVFAGTASLPGGVGLIGNMLLNGGQGDPPVYPNQYAVQTVSGGSGGASFWGGGGAGSNINPYGNANSGANGEAYGSGGGGSSAALNYSANGGNGAPGVCFVLEFF